MKGSAVYSAIVLAAGFFAGTASAFQGSAQLGSYWVEEGLNRYRIHFQGVSTDNWGDDFLNAIRDNGGVSSNWQCWYDDQYGWTFDDSEVEGCGGATIITDAIYDVTGQNSTQSGMDPVFASFGGCCRAAHSC